MTKRGLLVGLVVAGVVPTTAQAQRCEDLEAWAAACSSATAHVALERCLPGGAVVSATVEEERLEVEVARGRADAFRRVGELGVSPIAEYPDWNAAPERVHVAFDAVLRCVERGGADLTLPEGELRPSGRDDRPVSVPFPWLLLAAFLVSLGALALHSRRARPSAPAWARSAAVPLALTALALVARAALVAPSFVHQNGQGPLWVAHALCVHTVYGPGYMEVFGAAVRALGGEPSDAVFTLQAVLGAFATGAVWAIARGVGAGRVIALVLGLAVAVEPALARISQSESYFGTISSLLLLAGGVLALGARRGRVRDPVFVLATVAAGLFVAQAARIHPVAWVPAATLPVIVAAGRGRLRTRLVATVASAVGIGAVAAVLSLGVIGDITAGGVGDQWLPEFFERIPRSRLHRAIAVAAALAVLFAAAAKRRLRGAVRGALLFTVVSVAFGTHVIGAVGAIIVTGYLLLFLPAFIAVLGAGLEGIARSPLQARVIAAVVAATVVVSGIVRGEPLLELPTDAREQAWLLAHRGDVPDDATVAFLGVAGPRRRLHVPYYGVCGEAFGPTAKQLSVANLAGRLPTLTPTIWYRSSLCSTDEGRAHCDAAERRLGLTPIDTTDLRAIGSMEGLDYDDGTVHVGLYAIEGER